MLEFGFPNTEIKFEDYEQLLAHFSLFNHFSNVM